MDGWLAQATELQSEFDAQLNRKDAELSSMVERVSSAEQLVKQVQQQADAKERSVTEEWERVAALAERAEQERAAIAAHTVGVQERLEQKISQAELGDKLGVSFQQVQKYEKGVNRVGAARLQQIASALDVPVTFFYDGDNKAREVESLLFLDSAFSLRLLRAYSKIKDQTVQRQLVSLMESIAANED